MANALGKLFGDIASAIRSKTGEPETAKMKPADFPTKIASIEVGDGGVGNNTSVNGILDEINGEVIGEEALKDLILDSGSCGSGVTYKLHGDGGLVIEGSGAITSNPWADKYASKVKTVSIQNGVTEIANTIFQSHRYLSIVGLPDTLTTIGMWAFSGCTSLAIVLEIPASVSSIMTRAFAGCTKLSYAKLKETSGWKVQTYKSGEGLGDFIDLPENIAEDPAQVAVCLRETYLGYWQRS